MGSKLSVPVISFLDGVLLAVGCGPIGLYLIFRDGITSNFAKTCFVTFASAFTLYFFCRERPKINCPCTHVILITGCDSGLGYSFAKSAVENGFVVVAGFLNINSIGSKQLQQICGKYLIPIQLDITNADNVEGVGVFLTKYFKKNPSGVFHALVNNAGIMVFGEFDWLTKSLIEKQVKVNLLGTMHLTHVCIPLLRKYKGRIITVGSHCAFATLPGLAVYGATKAALHAWSDGIRLELAKFDIKVIKFVPGSFITQSKIFDRLQRDQAEIEKALTHEKRIAYNNYIERYYGYLNMIPTPENVQEVTDPNLYKQFNNALSDKHPKSLYKNEPFHYKLNHFLFKISPTPLRDYFVNRFVHLPEWSPTPVYPSDFDI